MLLRLLASITRKSHEFESCGLPHRFCWTQGSLHEGASRMKKFLLSLPLLCLTLLAAIALPSAVGPGYHLIKKVPLSAAPGGGEYFDYVTVDSASRRVYLSHGAEGKVVEGGNFSVGGAF